MLWPNSASSSRKPTPPWPENGWPSRKNINIFLNDLFQSPDPAHNGRTVTVAETLDAAAKKLDTDLTNQSALRARLQSTLGLTYFALGLYAEAIPLQEKARDYYLAAEGLEHEDTLHEMNHLANSHDGIGGQEERQKALNLREQVLALELKVNGPEAPDTIKAMNNVAISYGEAGRRDEAIKLGQEVLVLCRKVHGPEHPDTLLAMHDLASCFVGVGRWEEESSWKSKPSPSSARCLARKTPPPWPRCRSWPISTTRRAIGTRVSRCQSRF